MKKNFFQKSFALFLSAIFVSGFFIPATTSAVISTLNLTSPNGGEEWRGVQNITWSGVSDNASDKIDISYAADGINFTQLIASNITFSDFSYSWDTTILADSSSARIRISPSGFPILDDSAAVFMIDNTAPVTVYSIVPGSPDGTNGWYVSVPTITLTCGDGSGSGCSATYYKWDGAAGWTTYVGSFSALEGEHVLSFYSEDQAVDAGGFHNEETVQTETIKVDTTFPAVAVSSVTPDGSYKAGSDINATLTFSEPVYSTDSVTVNFDSGGSCSVPQLNGDTVATCTYTVLPGENSLDLSVTSIVPDSGVVEDIAGNDSTLSPTSNIDDTSDIIIDTTAPAAFATGTVTITGAPVVIGWWNSYNTGADVDVPVDGDASLIGGTIQIQVEATGTFENVGLPYIIAFGDLGNTVTVSLNEADIEAVAGFSDGQALTFRAVITDLAGNPTTGSDSADTFTVDQTLPTVDAGSDQEVNAGVSQDATVSDVSGISTYSWTSDPAVSFGTPNAEDTTLSSASDGVYTVTLTVTDNAGNVNLDTMQFAWDTTAPNLTEVTAIKDPTNNTTPSYVFNVDSVKQLAASADGTIVYAGSCGDGDLAFAMAGDNTTVYGPLGDTTYSDCEIYVTDAAGNTSSALAVSSFEIDTIVATVLSIKTYDTDFDGKVDTAEITFDDEVDDSTFVASDFSIGGVSADGFSTGTANDDVVTITVSAGVDGTEEKTVAYVAGTATDLAGNVIGSFSQTSTDLAQPVMLSAETTSTTTIDTVWSEDLDGTTVNPTGTEFTVTGFAVSAADETSAGVVTLTVATMPTDATPDVKFTNVDSFQDLNSNEAYSPKTVTASDGVAPVLDTVSIGSDNANVADAPLFYAMEGDTITVSFTASEAIDTPTVLIQGVTATSVINVAGNSWTASRAMDVGDSQGGVTFTIDFEDLPGNVGTTVTAVTDGTSVFFDSVNPDVDAGTDKEVNAIVNQDATVLDPVPSSGGLVYQWTNETPGVGTITFGTPNAEDTTISADTDGTYTISLTVTDNAGNKTTDTLTFIWDTTNPEPLTSTPSDGTTGVSILAGTATVVFDEDIVLLDSSRILLVNDSTGASYKGTTSVNGGDGASGTLDITYSGLAYGVKYRINVKPNAISDVATNKLASNFISYFTTEIDTVSPVVNSFSAGSITTDGATLSVATNENATCRYSQTDSAYSAMTSFTTTGTTSHSVVLTGLTPSTGYDFFVRCADTSAQANEMTTSAHASFTTLTPDTTAPVISNIQASVTDTSATITWTTNENATSRVEYGITSLYGSFSSVDATADNTNHSVEITGLMPGTDYHFRVLSNDASANAGASGDNTFTTTDTTAPDVPAITTASTTVDADTYTIAGTVANDGGVRIVSLYNSATLAGTISVPTGTTAWSILVPLTQDSANVFTATATDTVGNTSGLSTSVTITEATAVGDIVAPETPVITTLDAAGIDADTYTIAGTAGADLPSDGNRTITVYNNGVVMGSLVLPAGQTDWSFVATLNQNSSNTFTAYSTDEAGNTSAASNSVMITEADAPTPPDTTAPAVSSVQTSSIGTSSVTITWTTDEASSSQVEYGATSSYGSFTVADVTPTTSHSVTITGLSADTTYHFRVLSVDASANSGVSDDNIFSTEIDDSTATLQVTGISAVKTYAVDDDTYTNGWSWIFSITVPTAETSLQMKFADWTSVLPSSIAAANNIQYSSDQASNGPITITEAGVFGGALELTADLDATKAGRQIEVLVEAKVPAGSDGGSYTTSYGIFSEAAPL